MFCTLSCQFISGTSPMSNFSCWVIVLESAFIICKSIKVSLMQANDPSPHAVFVLQVKTPWAFDLWLHVSIEVIPVHWFTTHVSSCFCWYNIDIEVSVKCWSDLYNSFSYANVVSLRLRILYEYLILILYCHCVWDSCSLRFRISMTFHYDWECVSYIFYFHDFHYV